MNLLRNKAEKDIKELNTHLQDQKNELAEEIAARVAMASKGAHHLNNPLQAMGLGAIEDCYPSVQALWTALLGEVKEDEILCLPIDARVDFSAQLESCTLKIVAKASAGIKSELPS